MTAIFLGLYGYGVDAAFKDAESFAGPGQQSLDPKALAGATVFGLALPANVPVWVAALLLCILYGIFAGPLKLARHACYRGMGRPGWAWSFVFLLDAVVWLAVIVALLWLAVHFVPEWREAVHSLPSVAHQAADDIQTWWKGK